MSGWELSADDLKLFLEEADEMLQGMEEGILRLEKQADDAESLRALFRQAHTLKGSAATLGNQGMARVAHALESSLEPLRQGQGVATPALIDALLVGLDALRTFRDSIAGDSTRTVDMPVVMARLEAALAGQAAPPPAPAVAGPTPAGGGAGSPEPGAPVPDLEPADRTALSAALATGGTAWWVTVPVDPRAPMRSVRAYQAYLEMTHLGTLVRTWPAPAALEQDQLEDALVGLLVSTRPPEELAATLARIEETGPVRLVPADVPAQAQVHAPAPAAATVAADRAGGEPAPAAPGQETPLGSQQESRGSQQENRTIRVDVGILDTLLNLVGELVIDRTRLLQVISENGGEDERFRDLAATAAHIGRVTTDLQDQIMRARMLPVSNLFRKFPRMVRDVAQQLGKEVDLVLDGEQTELDRAVMEEIADPLMHLVRNALDHGIEPPMERMKAGKAARGTLSLTAAHQDERIVITIRDDGRGIDSARIREAAVRKNLISADAARRLSEQEALNLIFAPGFSTKEQVTDLSGRGVGMDVVRQNLEKLNATVEISTESGKGTEFRLKIPLTLAILRALLVEMLGEVYACPLTSVVEIADLSSCKVQTVRGRRVILFRGEVVPLITPEEAFALPPGPETGRPVVLLVRAANRQFGLVVDRLHGEQEIVVKPLGKTVGEVPGISGGTILGNGNVALILDVARLAD